MSGSEALGGILNADPCNLWWAIWGLPRNVGPLSGYIWAELWGLDGLRLHPFSFWVRGVGVGWGPSVEVLRLRL